MYAIIAGDELTSLCKAKQFPKWSEWQKSIKNDLDALKEKGTWELVQNLPMPYQSPINRPSFESEIKKGRSHITKLGW
jgi:hypothetical protein